jgi:hypothetical protein
MLKYRLEFLNIVEVVRDNLVKICEYLLEPRVIDRTHYISLEQKSINNRLLEIQLYAEHLLVVGEILDSSIKFGGVFAGFEFAQQDSVNQKDKILVVILIFHVSVALVFAGHHLSHVQ